MQGIARVILILSVVLLCQANTFVVDPAKNAAWHNEKGIYYLQFGFYGAAIKEFELAILLNPNSQGSASFYNNLGKTYLKLGVYNYALESFQKAINLNPNFLEYFENLVLTFEATKSIDSAIKKYESMINSKDYNSRTFLVLGLLNKKKNNKVEAINNLSTFRRMEPDLHITREVESIIKELSKSEQ